MRFNCELAVNVGRITKKKKKKNRDFDVFSRNIFLNRTYINIENVVANNVTIIGTSCGIFSYYEKQFVIF